MSAVSRKNWRENARPVMLMHPCIQYSCNHTTPQNNTTPTSYTLTPADSESPHCMRK